MPNLNCERKIKGCTLILFHCLCGKGPVANVGWGEISSSNFGTVQQHTLFVLEQPVRQPLLTSASRSDQYLGRHTSTALTCREYMPLGKFRLSLKASARYQLSSRALKIMGYECASTISFFCYFFLKKWSISLLTPWYLPRVHQRQRQEADCWG